MLFRCKIEMHEGANQRRNFAVAGKRSYRVHSSIILPFLSLSLSLSLECVLFAFLPSCTDSPFFSRKLCREERAPRAATGEQRGRREHRGQLGKRPNSCLLRVMAYTPAWTLSIPPLTSPTGETVTKMRFSRSFVCPGVQVADEPQARSWNHGNRR